MNLSEEFLPIDGPPTVKSNYTLYAIMLLVSEVLVLFISTNLYSHLLIAVGVFLLIFILVITDSSAVKVTISKVPGTFTYRTMNWLGNEKDTIVDIPTATISYKFTLIAKGDWGWRLRLYNSYFGNRITLKEKRGFSKEQLDEMAALLEKYQTNSA